MRIAVSPESIHPNQSIRINPSESIHPNQSIQPELSTADDDGDASPMTPFRGLC